MSTVIVVTRKNDSGSASEWESVWGFGGNKSFMAFKGNTGADMAAADLIVLKGGVTFKDEWITSHISPKLRLGDTKVYLHSPNAKGDFKTLFSQDCENINVLPYSLGDNNNSPDINGKAILERARILKSNGQNPPGDTGDGISTPVAARSQPDNPNDPLITRADQYQDEQSMYSFFRLIAPLCLSDGKEIKNAVCASFISLTKNAAEKIEQAIRKQPELRCALGDLVNGEKWTEAVDWVVANRPALIPLARRYL